MSRIRANTITNQNANGAPNFPDGITVTGIVTATTTSQNITGTLAVTGDATFSGNVGIAGTLTYEDVKNVDSIGIVTARSGIRVTSTTDGIAVGTNAMVSGRADNVLHLHKASGGTADGPTIYFTNQQTGVTGSDGLTIGLNDSQSPYIWNRENTATRFGTNNAERLRIGSSGQIGIAGANYGTSGQVLTSGGASASVAWATLEGGKVRNYKHVVDSGYSASSWASFTQVASFSYTPLQSTSKIIVIASLNLLWENSNVSNARMKFGSNSYVQFDKVEKAASVSGWFSGNAISIFHLGTAGNTSSNAVILELQGTGSHTSYFNYSSGDSQFLLLEMAPEG